MFYTRHSEKIRKEKVMTAENTAFHFGKYFIDYKNFSLTFDKRFFVLFVAFVFIMQFVRKVLVNLTKNAVLAYRGKQWEECPAFGKKKVPTADDEDAEIDKGSDSSSAVVDRVERNGLHVGLVKRDVEGSIIFICFQKQQE